VTRLLIKFDTHSSFHISINEENSPSINNTGAWPNCRSISPSYCSLSPDQIYSSDASSITASFKPTRVITLPTVLMRRVEVDLIPPDNGFNLCDFHTFYQKVSGFSSKCCCFTKLLYVSNYKILCINETLLRANDTIFCRNIFLYPYTTLRASISYINSNISRGDWALTAISK
jgi:hypothetical protein